MTTVKYKISEGSIPSLSAPCLQNMEDEYYHISTYLHGNWTPSAMISTVDLFLNTVKPCATNLIDPSYGDNQIILSTNDKINLFNYLDQMVVLGGKSSDLQLSISNIKSLLNSIENVTKADVISTLGL
jgi:hypothetical protein